MIPRRAVRLVLALGLTFLLAACADTSLLPDTSASWGSATWDASTWK